MSTLPVLLKDPQILLIGGGLVAYRKASVLNDNLIRFKILAETLLPEFDLLDPAVDTINKALTESDLKPFNIIVDATGNPAVAKLLLAEKQQRFVLINVVDFPEQCDFYFSSLLNYGKLKIAVSTDGASPTVGQVVRDKIKSMIPDNFAELVDERAAERSRGEIDVVATREQTLTRLAQVFLIGCGPGDVNLLTLQAYACIQKMDVVLYDHLIPQQILDIVPDTAQQVYVGKQKDVHSRRQEEINQIILDYARQGLKVARLKSGDPYIFGRGAEEAEFLAQHGVRVQVVSGISSALSAPASAGIPLTARGYAANVSIVSAHLSGSRINTDWLPMLQIPNHTTVVLMGLSFAREIAELALASGVSSEMPVAIVSNASRETQRTIITTLADLPEESLRAERPAVLVFGDVVRLHHILPHR
ncbi:MAG: uroporphyrinogen-III C-methyltransferase [Desulfuromonadales bacterium]|nr:uroporphyrinogen-III C-methyltransferase [Desulfuromonadales bacterium]